MMTIGCERIASRLERLEREAQIATEQARIEAASLANRSFWERSWDHIWTHKVGYGLVALLVVGTYYIVSYFPKPKQQEEEPSQRNNPSAESSHKIEENVILQQPPVQHGEENNQLLEVNTQHQNQPIVEAENQGGIEISPDVFIIGEDEIEDPIADKHLAEVYHEEAPVENLHINEHPEGGAQAELINPQQDLGVDDTVVEPQEEEEKTIPEENFLENVMDIDEIPDESVANANSLLQRVQNPINEQVVEPVNFNLPVDLVQTEDSDRVAEEAQTPNQLQPLNQINKSISLLYSLIGMPNLNKFKSMLALEYYPIPVEPIVMPEQVVNFISRQLVNYPWMPNGGVFNEPFIQQQHYEKTFKQKSILMLMYDPNRVSQPKMQIKGSQKVNVSQQINIPQMLADYAEMEAKHTEPIIVEVNQ